MLNNEFLAVIPARAGSKRLANKNMLELGGKPLISWTIEAALGSKYLSKNIVVSSDCQKILDCSIAHGINVIRRPRNLATDEASSIDVLMHVLDLMQNNYKYVVLLQPTSPYRGSKHIDSAIEYLKLKQADAVISVCETEHNPLWSNTLPADNSMIDFINDDIKNMRYQSLPQYYQLNGAIYICSIDKLIEGKTFFLKKNVFAYRMEKNYSIDIDTMNDLKFASFLLPNLFQKELL